MPRDTKLTHTHMATFHTLAFFKNIERPQIWSLEVLMT